MQLLDLIAPAGSTASVGAALMGWYVWRDGKRDKAAEAKRKVEAHAAELQRKLDRADQTKAIQDAIGVVSEKMDARFNENDRLTTANTQRIDKLDEAQFGDNHGGARQAINETQELVRGIDKRLVRIETVVFPPPLARAAA